MEKEKLILNAVRKSGYDYAKEIMSCFKENPEPGTIMSDGRVNPHVYDQCDQTNQYFCDSEFENITFDEPWLVQELGDASVYDFCMKYLTYDEFEEAVYQGVADYFVSEYGDNWESDYPEDVIN